VDLAIPNNTAQAGKAKLSVSWFVLSFHDFVFNITTMKLQITQGQLIYTSCYDIS